MMIKVVLGYSTYAMYFNLFLHHHWQGHGLPFANANHPVLHLAYIIAMLQSIELEIREL